MSKLQAENMLDILRDIVAWNGYVSYASYRVLLGLEPAHDEWGWRNLDEARVANNADGYFVAMPPCMMRRIAA